MTIMCFPKPPNKVACQDLLDLVVVKPHSWGAECIFNLISLWWVMWLSAALTLAVTMCDLLWFNLQTFPSGVCYHREWLISSHRAILENNPPCKRMCCYRIINLSHAQCKCIWIYVKYYDKKKAHPCDKIVLL